MFEHPSLVIEGFSRPVEMLLEPLLKSPMIMASEQRLCDDTEGVTTEATSVTSPGSADSRHSVSGSLLSQPSEQYIDNTRRTYVPITVASGNTIHCAPDVLAHCPMILRSIQTDILGILNILPRSVHALVKRTNIWVNLSYSYGTQDDPNVLRHSTAHHEEGWLVRCARDRPEKSQCIEIYSCFDFERMRLHWNGCGLLLHEFCHLIHQECLGLDNPHVVRLYTEAYKSGRYEEVLRRDWAGKEEDFDMAYAMVDPKEFFAEMSVSFWSRGYRQLDYANRATMVESSPPLIEPGVVTRLMHMYKLHEDAYEEVGHHGIDSCFHKAPRPKVRIVDPIWREAAMVRSCRDIKHCNKFYPFTAGQLKHLDPTLFREMDKLWNEIAMYEDPSEEPSCCFLFTKIFPSIRL